jgi:hypothetical protein
MREARTMLGQSPLALAALIVAVLALAGVAAALLRGGERHELGLGPAGVLHAVMLINGQIYYGTLAGETAGAVVLEDVFYVQVTADAQSQQRTNRIMRRAETDWHGPERMSVPHDKILFVELVGAQSQLAKLIAEAKAKR